jgi:hypothetical protein
MFSLGGGTGFRKSKVALPANVVFDDRRLSRSSVLWLIGGIIYSDPSRELLLSMVPCRDFVMIKPPRSKTDQDGNKFCALPIYLFFDPSGRAKAAHWLQRLVLRLPCHGQHREARPLFFEDTKTFRPMSHGTIDRYLGLLLHVLMPEAEACK